MDGGEEMKKKLLFAVLCTLLLAVCAVAQATGDCTEGHLLSENLVYLGDGTHGYRCQREGCDHTENVASCSGGTATTTQGALCKDCGGEYTPKLTQYTYSIWYSGNPGNGAWSKSMKSTETQYTMTVYTMGTPTREGYQFTGKWSDEIGGGKEYKDGNMITLTADKPSITLYAVWEKVETTCDREGHDLYYKPCDDMHHMAYCTRESECHYSGKSEKHKDNADGSACTLCGAYCYYLAFNTRSGQGTWGSTTYSLAETYNMSITYSVPTKAGGTFSHWTDGTKNYVKGQKYALSKGNQSATLYAVYTHEGACSGDEKASCTEYGICQYCRKPYLNPDKHDLPSSWTQSGTQYARTHSRECSDCGRVDGPYACEGGKATCKRPAVCTTCHGEWGGLGSHDYTGNPYYQHPVYNLCHAQDCAVCGYVKYGNHSFNGICGEQECTICKLTYNPGHSWDFANAVPNNDATCYCSGTQTIPCEYCDETLTLTNPNDPQKSAHEFINYVADNNATCTEDGTETAKCKWHNGWKCTATDTHEIPDSALGHSYGSKASDKQASAATCTEAATYYVQCDNCDAVSDTLTVSVGEPNGHKEEIVPGKPAACTETGLTDGVKCSVCNETLTTQQVIPVTAHDYKATVTAPTCTKRGYTTYTCANCTASYTANETSARGHYYGAWTFDGINTHSAECLRNACKHTGTVACEWFDWKLSMKDETEYRFTFCPVCGEVKDGSRLPLVEMVEAEALTERRPGGEIVLRVGKLADGEIVMSVGFEYGGRLTQPKGKIEVTLPASVLEGYAMTLLNEDGTESELSFRIEDDVMSFTLDFTVIDKTEKPQSVRVIHLVPAAQ